MPGTYAASLITKVSAEGVEETKHQLGEVSKKTDEAKGHFEGLKNALSFAAGQALFTGIGAGFGFLKDQLGQAFQQSMDAQAGMALTVQVLKSTHDASGMTAQSIGDLATQYSHLTMFQDDTVQSAENMLLTFTNIGQKVFPQATKTVLDMSQALGQDTKSSAIQLGKALNDPLTGITALSRVGVTFTQGQKDSIKAMMDHNQIAKAQGVILTELQREFGGAAEAAGKTFGGQMAILNQSLDDFRQNIGDALLPYVTQFTGWISGQALPLLTKFSDWFVGHGIPALQQLLTKIQSDGLPLLNRFSSWFRDTALPVIQRLGGDIQTNLLPPLGRLLGNVTQSVTQFGNWAFQSGAVTKVLEPLIGIIGGAADKLADFVGWMNKGGPAANTVKVELGLIGGVLVSIKIAEFGQLMVSTMQSLLSPIGKVIDAISGIGTTMKTKVAVDVAEGSAVAEAEIGGLGTKSVETAGVVEGSAAGMSASLKGVLGLYGLLLAAEPIVAQKVADQADPLRTQILQLKARGQAIPPYLRQAAQDAGVNPDSVNTPAPISIANTRGHASGILNNPVGHWAMVGERGPEPMYVPQGASILPSGMSPSALGGGGSPVVVQLNIGNQQIARVLMPAIVTAIRNNTGVRY